jgi:hypothetical protein
MLACPRCGFAFPYWRSRKWRMRLLSGGVTAGRRCPWCHAETTRRPAPFWVKPFQLVTLRHCSYRTCARCSWRGIAFHARTGQRRRRHRPQTERPA